MAPLTFVRRNSMFIAMPESGLSARMANYCLPGDLEREIEAFIAHYNHRRYHESIDNLAPRPTSTSGAT